MESRKLLLYWVRWSLKNRRSHAVVVDADGFTISAIRKIVWKRSDAMHKSDTSKREILARIDLWQVREAVHFCAKEGRAMSIGWRLGAVARGLRPRFVAIDLSRSC